MTAEDHWFRTFYAGDVSGEGSLTADTAFIYGNFGLRNFNINTIHIYLEGKSSTQIRFEIGNFLEISSRIFHENFGKLP